MEKERRCPSCGKVVPDGGDDKHGLLFMLGSAAYLDNPQARRMLTQISQNWKNSSRGSLSQDQLSQIHPVMPKELEQSQNHDIYAILTDCMGFLTRTHGVRVDGHTFINPPPADHRCESCHNLAGPIRKHFQNSKLDGANIPVWLCVDCEKLPPDQRDVRF